MTINSEFLTIGKRPVRHDGVEKVTGRAIYGADMNLPGMIYAKVLRSPYAHARIKNIDFSDLKNHPDCIAVVTSEDMPIVQKYRESVIEKNKYPEPRQSFSKFTEFDNVHLVHNILAVDKVMYRGHPIAAVAARNPHKAEELLDLIKVEYEVLAPVISIDESLKNDAPNLTDIEIKRNIINNSISPGKIVNWANIGGDVYNVLGDLGKGIAEADYIVEKVFTTQTVHQGYIEPQNGTAEWLPDGNLKVWCSSQGHFGIRDQLAKALEIPESSITVIPLEIGGGFGGKLKVYLEVIAALLAKKSGMPVKMSMSRSEVFEATGPASGSFVKIKMGARANGQITFAQAFFILESGAYFGAPVGGAANCIFVPYDISNVSVEGYEVLVNKPPTSAYRAPGSPIVSFGVESVIDDLAELIGMESLDFRIQNVAKEGSRRSTGLINPKIGALETMKAVKAHPHYTSSLDHKISGRGVAFGFWSNGGGAASVVANVLPDGTVSLIEGSVDIGGTRTSISQQFAEVLQIPVEAVKPRIADTDGIGYTSSTGGSGVTYKSGIAAIEAANDVKKQMLERASIMWETTVDKVSYDKGVIHLLESNKEISFSKLAEKLNSLGGPVVGRANLNPSTPGGSFAASLVDVEIDPDTGKVSIIRFTSFQDAGKAIHPSYVEGQMQGGSVQGIGWALNEYYHIDNQGIMKNNTLLDYRMPISLDLPMIDTEIIEVPNPGHLFGVRGVGEASIVPPMAAIANAIKKAVGTRLTNLPMDPKSVLNALRN